MTAVTSKILNYKKFTGSLLEFFFNFLLNFMKILVISGMNSIKILILFHFLIGITVVRAFFEQKCSDFNRSAVELHLSTKTPYRVVANYEDTPSSVSYPGLYKIKLELLSNLILLQAVNPEKYGP